MACAEGRSMILILLSNYNIESQLKPQNSFILKKLTKHQNTNSTMSKKKVKNVENTFLKIADITKLKHHLILSMKYPNDNKEDEGKGLDGYVENSMNSFSLL